MRVTSLKKICALALAVIMIVSTFAIAASATSQSGSNTAFGSWTCSTSYSGGKYITKMTCTKAGKLYQESEYQSYPSGATYKTITFEGKTFDGKAVTFNVTKEQQSTIWSFHNWKASSGTGMTRYTQLVNA